jgi:hypothetical protein
MVDALGTPAACKVPASADFAFPDSAMTPFVDDASDLQRLLIELRRPTDDLPRTSIDWMSTRRDIIARLPGLSAPAPHLNFGSTRIPQRASAFTLWAAGFHRASNDMPRRLFDIPHRDDDTRACVNHLPRGDRGRWGTAFAEHCRYTPGLLADQP